MAAGPKRQKVSSRDARGFARHKNIEVAVVVNIPKQSVKHKISPLFLVLWSPDGNLSKKSFLRNLNF